MSFRPLNVCVTGGAGFIGANFVRHWLKRTAEGQVVVLDALTYAGNVENLAGLERDPRYAFVRGDICDEAAVLGLLEHHQIDTLVHFAAESHVDRSILGPDDFIRTNVVGTHSLLKAAKTFWVDRKSAPAHRFHHVSTDEVYGSLAPQDPPFHELTPYAPNSPYSASKAASGEPGAALIINGQQVADIRQDGHFHYFTEPMTSGNHTLVIMGQNRRGGTGIKRVDILIP